MTTMVHVIYTGIVSFAQLSSGVTWMVIPDGGGDLHHPHRAYVIVEDGAAAVSGLTEVASQAGLTAYALEDHLVEFGSGLGQSTAIEPACILPLAKGCPADNPQCARLASLYHNGHHAKVVARAQLPGGTLRASHVEALWDWEYDQGLETTHVGHLAQEVCHSFRLNGRSLNVSFQREGLEVATMRLVSRSGEPIELRIGNTPEDEIFVAAGANANPMTDEHVKLYYELSEPEVPAAARAQLVRIDDSPNDDCNGAGHAHRLDGHAMAARLQAIERAQLRDVAGKHRGAARAKRVGGMNCPPALWEQP